MFAALHIPEFPMVAIQRDHPELASRPAAVLGGQIGVARSVKKNEIPVLVATNQAARAAGLTSGWPLNRALLRCPNLQLLERDLAAETALQASLLSLAEAIGPDLEITATDTILLDLSLRQNPREQTLETIDSNSIGACYVIAQTAELAQLAVRDVRSRGRRVEVADLQSLTLTALVDLGATIEDLMRFKGWGLRTLGDFMRLPRQSLADRLGPEVGRWHDVLHGKSSRMLRLHRPLETIAINAELEYCMIGAEPLSVLIERLMKTIELRLTERHLAAEWLELRFGLDGAGEVIRRLRYPEPQTGARGMMPLVQTYLEGLQLSAPVQRVEVEIGTTFAIAAQREWLGRELPQPDRWAETLARLEGLLGPGRVGIPVPPESYQPDAFTMRSATDRAGVGGNMAYRPDCPVPLFRFRPPQVVAVASELREPWPWPLALLTGRHVGRIVAWRGPFPSSGTWWDASGSWQRLEWDVQLEDRHLLRLVFQPPDCWQLDGSYG